MKGRALQLFRDYQMRAASGAGGAFVVSRVILLARVIPEQLTPELDDPELEARIERAIARVDLRAAAE
jgi:hypothetical protein